MIHDSKGRAVAAFCVNVDADAIERLRRDFDAIYAGQASPADQPPADDGDLTLEELVNDIIEVALHPFRDSIDRMTKAERVAAVAAMQKRGMFLLRGSVDRVAKRMGTTKFTIYNYLEEIGAQ